MKVDFFKKEKEKEVVTGFSTKGPFQDPGESRVSCGLSHVVN